MLHRLPSLACLPKIEGLCCRTLDVVLSVSSIPQLFVEPKELSLEANKDGWIEETVTLWTEHFDTLAFGFELKDVGSVSSDAFVSGKFDCEFVPQEGWDGEKLLPGSKYTAKLRFYISSDLVPGTYEGEQHIWVTYREDKKVLVKLPIHIEIDR